MFEVTKVSDRVIVIRLVIGKKLVAIIYIYILLSQTCVKVLKTSFTTLEDALVKITDTQKVLICGDFNSTTSFHGMEIAFMMNCLCKVLVQPSLLIWFVNSFVKSTVDLYKGKCDALVRSK